MGIRDFRHGGLVVGEKWTPVPTPLSEPARAALRDFAGRHIRIHPEDVKNLAEVGLRSVDGKVSDLLDLAPTTPPTTTAKSAPKGDGKKS